MEAIEVIADFMRGGIYSNLDRRSQAAELVSMLGREGYLIVRDRPKRGEFDALKFESVNPQDNSVMEFWNDALRHHANTIYRAMLKVVRAA